MSAATLICPCDAHSLRCEPMTQPECCQAPAAVIQALQINQAHRAVLLPHGRAMTFAPRETTQLQLTSGRLWITFEAPANGLAPRNGDHFIAAGNQFDLLAGETAVLEAVGDNAAALFDLQPPLVLPWRAVAQRLRANVAPVIVHIVDRWQQLIDPQVA
ncbi:MAG: DUF2917 domain-containing protein [Burkholderiales bacterium]